MSFTELKGNIDNPTILLLVILEIPQLEFV